MAGIRDIMGLNKANFSTVEKDFEDITSRILSNEEYYKITIFQYPRLFDKGKVEITSQIRRYCKIKVPSVKCRKIRVHI